MIKQQILELNVEAFMYICIYLRCSGLNMDFKVKFPEIFKILILSTVSCTKAPMKIWWN